MQNSDMLSIYNNYYHSGSCGYCIAGNFQGRKLLWIGRKGAFCRENFHGILNWSYNGCGLPKISWRKLLRVAVKSQNSWRFSPSKISCYNNMVFENATWIWPYYFMDLRLCTNLNTLAINKSFSDQARRIRASEIVCMKPDFGYPF